MKIRLEHPVIIISYKFLIVMKCMFIMFVISPLFLSLVISCVRNGKVKGTNYLSLLFCLVCQLIYMCLEQNPHLFNWTVAICTDCRILF